MTSVLVLEDEEVLRLLITAVLEDAGLEVIALPSADEGLEFLERSASRIRIIVSDIQMPGHLDGYELCQMVTHRWPALPVVLTSGYSGKKLDLGPNIQFLPKPWSNEKLLGCVQQALSH